MTAILIDDEKFSLAALQKDLERYCPEVQIVATCQSAKEARKAIRKWNPQVIFLDINMPYENGFELLESIESLEAQIIFTTAHEDYALEAFRVNAIDYLLKPIQRELLKQAVEKASRNQGHPNTSDLLKQLRPMMEKRHSRIPVPTREGYEMIDTTKIIYAEADRNYTTFFLEGNQRVVLSKSLKECEEMLPVSSFCRIHHSHIINLDHLIRYMRGDGGQVTLSNDKTLSVSRNRKEDLLQKIQHNS